MIIYDIGMHIGPYRTYYRTNIGMYMLYVICVVLNNAVVKKPVRYRER